MRYFLSFFIGTLLLLSSCQKEIDLPLKNADPQLVIIGQLILGDSMHYVDITTTVPFDESNDFPRVSGALVQLYQGSNLIGSYQEESAGLYRLDYSNLIANTAYQLRVEYNGEVYEATSVLPEPVALNGVNFLPNQFFGDTGFIMVPDYTDPAGRKNYYAFQYVLLKNPIDVPTGIYIRDDEISDGQQNQQPLFEGFVVAPGDSIRLFKWDIDKSMYDFYFSKTQNTDPNSGAPANPVNNWSNNALGYFSARARQTISFVVPQ